MAAAPRFLDVLPRAGKNAASARLRAGLLWLIGRCRCSAKTGPVVVQAFRPSRSPVPADLPYSGACRPKGGRGSYLQLCAIVTVDSEPVPIPRGAPYSRDATSRGGAAKLHKRT